MDCTNSYRASAEPNIDSQHTETAPVPNTGNLQMPWRGASSTLEMSGTETKAEIERS